MKYIFLHFEKLKLKQSFISNLVPSYVKYILRQSHPDISISSGDTRFCII
jgi:hypothetical protein